MSRRAKAIIGAALVIALAAAATFISRLAPLREGFMGPVVTTSATGWHVQAPQARPLVVLKFQEHTEITIRFSVSNADSITVDLVDLDETIAEWRKKSAACMWQPRSARLLSTGNHGEPQFQEVALPHALSETGGDVYVEVTGDIGASGSGPCTSAGMAVGDLEVPLRFRWLGITRTQIVTLDLRLGIADKPEEHMETRITPLRKT